MKATEYDEKRDNVKSSLLLHCIGERAREVFMESVKLRALCALAPTRLTHH